jgi:hypothetical protein
VKVPFVVTADAMFALKRQLRLALPQVGSAHLSEAIAFGLGFRTNLDLHAAMRKNDTGSVLRATADDERFAKRIAELHGVGPTLASTYLTDAVIRLRRHEV